VSDRQFVRHQVAEDSAASAALLAAGVALATTAAFTIMMSSPSIRGWAPDASSSGGDAGSNVQLKPDADGKASSRSATRPSRTSHPSDISPGQSKPAGPVVDNSKPIVPGVSLIETLVGHSVEGRPLLCRRIGDGEYVVLMMASIHGNEAAGTPLLNRLAEHLVENYKLLAGVTLVLLPVVNPDGVESRQRYNARGVDLNRNFPAENRQNSSRYGLNALSEPESLAIYQVINDTLPNHIVTLHEPLQCVDYDGPAKELATSMSNFCPLPVKKLGSRHGSLGSYAGVTLGIPTVTFELPGNAAAQSDELLWRFYGEALIQAVLHRHPASL
jgi:protein MpaA